MRKFALIGKSLSHSFSRHYFSEKFEKEHVSASYSNEELAKPEAIPSVLNKGYQGLNVTIPYKQAIIPYLDELSEEANDIGAVNTVSFENGKAIGHNTDCFGFRQMIKPFFKSHHERAMIIGTGGASRSVAYVLENLGVSVIYISRNASDRDDVFTYDEINDNMITFNGIIVNTTPVGMYPNEMEEVSIPYPFLTDRHLVIDLIYNPEETIFLKKARLQGANTLNGLTMLHQQAEKAWEIWNKTKSS